MTDNTARLWGNPSDRAVLNTEFVDAPLVQDDLGMGAKVVIGIVFIVLGLFFFAAVIKKAAFQ